MGRGHTQGPRTAGRVNRFGVIGQYVSRSPVFYSYRSTTIGPTFIARRAGTKQAPKATAANKTGIAMKVRGSSAVTANNSFDINNEVTASAPPSPIATPMIVSNI